MSVKDTVFIRILFLLAKFFCAREEILKELKELETHVRVYVKADS